MRPKRRRRTPAGRRNTKKNRARNEMNTAVLRGTVPKTVGSFIQSFFIKSGLPKIILKPEDLRSIGRAMKRLDAIKAPASTRTSMHHLETALNALKGKIRKGEIRNRLTLMKELFEELGKAKIADLSKTKKEKLDDHIARTKQELAQAGTELLRTLKKKSK